MKRIIFMQLSQEVLFNKYKNDQLIIISIQLRNLQVSKGENMFKGRKNVNTSNLPMKSHIQLRKCIFS